MPNFHQDFNVVDISRELGQGVNSITNGAPLPVAEEININAGSPLEMLVNPNHSLYNLDLERAGKQAEIYFDDVLFPIAPSKMQTRIKDKNVIIDLASGGELEVLNDAGLTEWSFDLRLPLIEYPFAQYQGGFKNPKFYLDKLEKLKVEKSTFQFIVLRTFDSELDTMVERATLGDYEIVEDAGESNHYMMINVTVRKFNPLKTKDVSVKKVVVDSEEKVEVTEELKREEDLPEKPNDYVVKSGDTLYMICKQFLGDGERYREIATLNNISNPNLIFPEQVIRFV